MSGVAFERPELLLLLAVVPVVVVLALVTRQEKARGAKLAAATFLRALTIACVALAAAGPSLVRALERSSVVFVLDASPSVGPRGVAQGLQKIQGLAAGLASGTRAALVGAGADARVLVPLGSARDLAARLEKLSPEDAIAAVGSGETTDLARGLRLAAAVLESGAPGRIVVLSDGRETRGSARDEAERLRERGVVLDAVAIPGEAPLDARVSLVSTGSPEAREGEGLLVRVTVEATRAAHGRVVLARDGESRAEWERGIDLEAGKPETLSFPDRAERRGLHLYEARVEVAGDEEPRNDRGGCALLVRGGPEAVIVETNGEGEALAHVLDAQGFRVRRVSASKAPGARELAATDLVVLAGASLVGPEALPRERARDLEQFVREGGGLLAVGGDASFSLGGWQDTELETALPVDMEPPARGEQPSVALVIAIDKSGSMRGPKIELAKLAAKAATTGLSRQDELGVAAFNFNNYWIVPLSKLDDPARIRDRIDFQVAGGGTDLMPSLRAARACLEPSNARVKHFMILTDGIAGDEDKIIAYTAELAKKGITTSTVAVGEDAEQDFLKHIALAGHGRHYSADRVRELPKVVLQETLVAAQRAMEVEPFKPVRVRAHPVLAGVDIAGAPVLHGLNPTRAKPLATVLLEGPRHQPLLALWEHGLGRAGAWTSDATREWADAWLSWPGFPKLVGQLARHLARREGGQDLAVELDARASEDGSVVVRAEARRPDGRFANGVELEARVLSPEGAPTSSATRVTPGATAKSPATAAADGREVAKAAFEPVAPGRYEARVEGLAPGGYVVEVRGNGGLVGVAGFARACPAEYARLGADREALAAIARAGGGSLDPASVVASQRAGQERVPLGAPLLLAAALLVPLELALRRLGRTGG